MHPTTSSNRPSWGPAKVSSLTEGRGRRKSGETNREHEATDEPQGEVSRKGRGTDEIPESPSRDRPSKEHKKATQSPVAPPTPSPTPDAHLPGGTPADTTPVVATTPPTPALVPDAPASIPPSTPSGNLTSDTSIWDRSSSLVRPTLRGSIAWASNPRPIARNLTDAVAPDSRPFVSIGLRTPGKPLALNREQSTYAPGSITPAAFRLQMSKAAAQYAAVRILTEYVNRNAQQNERSLGAAQEPAAPPIHFEGFRLLEDPHPSQ